MNPLKVGKLNRVNIRTVWPKESSDFTPWLADNLDFLGDAIGIDLELEAQEKSVGSFRADILARDTLSHSWVLIENQFERTDHGHLGQLLTYASGLKATTVVWIAEQFAEEHIAALDWLNSITDESVRFFGVQVEAWSIDTSIAPRFSVVSRPNSWVKQGKVYKRSVVAYNSSFDRKQFVFDCLTSNPDMSIGDIQRQAQAINQYISIGSVSTYRKVFLHSSERDGDGPITGEFEKIVVNE